MPIFQATYITFQDVRDNSSNAKLVAEDGTLIKKMIIKAQILLDGYIGTTEKYSDTQAFKFPNKDNQIPDNVKMSTVYIVERIYDEMQRDK